MRKAGIRTGCGCLQPRQTAEMFRVQYDSPAFEAANDMFKSHAAELSSEHNRSNVRIRTVDYSLRMQMRASSSCRQFIRPR
jgi:hypothetical protein